MSGFRISAACAAQVRSAGEVRKTLQDVKLGGVDILIGTHRLLSADVRFADLGLVIVDEEQRFGVEHKTRLRQVRKTVDVLTMTATPIPRTLHMAMLGIRDISTLATPPPGRRRREARPRRLPRRPTMPARHGRTGASAASMRRAARAAWGRLLESDRKAKPMRTVYDDLKKYWWLLLISGLFSIVVGGALAWGVTRLGGAAALLHRTGHAWETDTTLGGASLLFAFMPGDDRQAGMPRLRAAAGFASAGNRLTISITWCA